MKLAVDSVRFYDVVLQWTKCPKAKRQRLGQFVVNEIQPLDCSEDMAQFLSPVFYAETVDDFWTVVFDHIELTQ